MNKDRRALILALDDNACKLYALGSLLKQSTDEINFDLTDCLGLGAIMIEIADALREIETRCKPF